MNAAFRTARSLTLLQAAGPENSFWTILPDLLWFAFVVVALILFRRSLVQLINMIIWRLRVGSALKVASFEIGPAIAMGQEFPSGSTAFYSDVRLDDQDRRFHQRESYYLPNRNLQLVHRVAPSQNPEYAFDVLIYLIPHPGTDATLASVKHVEYYCGRGWGDAIFTIVDRSRSFPIALSTRSPFLCTAELHFTDGEIVTIVRYIDGEMLGLAPAVTQR